MTKVLVVEDDPKLSSVLARVLCEEGHEPVVVATMERAFAMVEERQPDLAVVDRMLPDGDGLDLCRRLRRAGVAVPVLMLTALGELADRVAGLDAGADDYVVKPFELEELLARVRALLRRSSAPVRTAGPLRIDFRARRVWDGDRAIDVTAREFDVLAHLVEAEGAVLSRSRLLAAVWATDRDPGTNLVEVHVSRLRSKLADVAWSIETVRGGGYRFRREPP